MDSRSTGLQLGRFTDGTPGEIQHEVGTIIGPAGQEYSASGAHVDDYHIAGYLHGQDRPFDRGEFQTWGGDVIGHYIVISSWRTSRSYMSDVMVSAEVTLRDGRKYIVRGGGTGMLARGRRASCQLRPIRRERRSF